MRGFGVGALGALLLSGCVTVAGEQEFPPPARPTSGTTTTTAPGFQEEPATNTTMSTTTLPEPTTTSSLPPQPLALITPSGVPVAILEAVDTGWRVLTPCGREALLPGGTPVGRVDVVLDPGHGGEADIGAVGPNGLTEKEINLAVARAVEERLHARGTSVLLTRTADYASILSARAALADAVQAELMVSIHHNAPTPGPSPTPGTEVFVQQGSGDSRRLGGLLHHQVVEALSSFEVAWTAAPDAGVMTVTNTRGSDAYGIIRHPDTTTALVEIGYISNRAEAELFATPEYLEVVADALADAISAYLETDMTGGRHVEGRVFNPAFGIGGGVCVDPALG